MFGAGTKQKKTIQRLAEYEEKLHRYEKELQKQDDACRIHMLNPSRICPNPNQPRKNFDRTELQSIRRSAVCTSL